MTLFRPQMVAFRFLPEGKPKAPTKAFPGDAGYDLYVSRAVTIPPRSFVDVHTDIAAAFPGGYWGRITGRSSTVRRYGLQVQEGVIDNGWRGELFIGVWNLKDEEVELAVGDRVAQIIFQPVVNLKWVQVEQLPGSHRGTKGFGSSGR